MSDVHLEEILVLHHSHLDIGFTHSQPIITATQHDFISQALDLLDKTADWLDPKSQPKWTCEVTFQVTNWLEKASAADISRFENYLSQRRIGISALQYHLTPLSNAEQLIRHLYPARILRERFGAALNTINLHDVDGLPWTSVDIFLDAGIELLIMAINPHLGRAAADRPSIFRWQGPSGRELLVMNGAHYTMFDQLLYTPERELARMEQGLAEYTAHLSQHGYPHDFIYLTTADAPVCYDNCSPNLDTALLIQEWNETSRKPAIRYIVPEELLERIQRLSVESLPLFRGDWTDYWNFGSASTAMSTRVNRNTKPRLYTADLLSGLRSGLGRSLAAESNRAWERLNRYDEHTWGSWNSWEHESPFTRSQAILKESLAYEAHEMAGFVLLHRLEELAENPLSSWKQAGVMVVNSTASPRTEYVQIPSWWRNAPKFHRTARLGQWGHEHKVEDAPWCGPLELPPFSANWLPLSELPPLQTQAKITIGDGFLESAFHRLAYDPENGRITSLVDKERNWDIAAQNGPWSLFEFVHERPLNPTRKAFYDRDLELEKSDLSCWKKDWQPQRSGTTRFVESRVESDARGATLVLHYEAPGMKQLVQRLTLTTASPLIEWSFSCYKEDVRDPESVYFAIPLNLAAGWQAHFDTGGIPVELDSEQLPAACRDWVTAESYVSVHNGDRGVTLYCPDAPMVQIGDFNFGRVQNDVPRSAEPLLLAWPLNNYWDTNFRATQPGHIQLRYFLSSHGPFDPVQAFRVGRVCLTPLEVHPAIDANTEQTASFLNLTGQGIELLHLKEAEDGRGVIVRLINFSQTPTQGMLAFTQRQILAAFAATPLEEPRLEEPCELEQGILAFTLNSRQITTLYLDLK